MIGAILPTKADGAPLDHCCSEKRESVQGAEAVLLHRLTCRTVVLSAAVVVGCWLSVCAHPMFTGVSTVCVAIVGGHPSNTNAFTATNIVVTTITTTNHLVSVCSQSVLMGLAVFLVQGLAPLHSRDFCSRTAECPADGDRIAGACRIAVSV